MSTMAHQGKVALITGVGSGLGRKIAHRFLSEGINVVGCDVNKTGLAEFKEAIASTHSDSATLLIECDITSSAALDDLFAQAEKTYGKLDYVINSAGIMDRFDPAGDLEEKMWDRVIAVNLTAPTMITKRAVNAMVKAGTKGSIVNIASVAGVRGFSAGVAYTASKHGVLGLTKNTAAFYGPKGIRCNAIMAGAMQTNIGNHLGQPGGMNMEGYAIMMKTFDPASMVLCDLEKMAKLVLYLCSDDAEMLSGSIITADAGATVN